METLASILPELGWSRGFLLFAILGVFFAIDALGDLKDWLADRGREGRLAPPLARTLRRVRLLEPLDS